MLESGATLLCFSICIFSLYNSSFEALFIFDDVQVMDLVTSDLPTTVEL